MKNHEALTFLEFGSIDVASQKKSIWDFRLHQEAYDFFMLARYMKDLIAFRNLTSGSSSLSLDSKLEVYRDTVYTQDLFNSFTKLAALQVSREHSRTTRVSFLELGSTLMGCIDAMAYLQSEAAAKGLDFSAVDLLEVDWHGIDISALLNDVAKALYPTYSLTTYLHYADFNQALDVFFAKGVSLLYAFESEAQFAALLSRAKLGVFDYSFALNESQVAILGTGKAVSYLSLDGVVEQLSSANSRAELFFDMASCHVDEQQRRVRTLCYWGEPELVRECCNLESRLRMSFAELLTDPS